MSEPWMVRSPGAEKTLSTEVKVLHKEGDAQQPSQLQTPLQHPKQMAWPPPRPRAPPGTSFLPVCRPSSWYCSWLWSTGHIRSGHAPGEGVSSPGADGVVSTCQLRVFSHPLFPSFQSGWGLTSHQSCCEDRPRKPKEAKSPALPTSALPSGHPGRAPLAPGLLPLASGPPCHLLPLFLWAPSAGNSWVPELGLLTCTLHPGPPVPVSQLQWALAHESSLTPLLHSLCLVMAAGANSPLKDNGINSQHEVSILNHRRSESGVGGAVFHLSKEIVMKETHFCRWRASAHSLPKSKHHLFPSYSWSFASIISSTIKRFYHKWKFLIIIN